MDMSVQAISSGYSGYGNNTNGVSQTQEVEEIRPGQVASTPTTAIDFSNIVWDNGTDIGINDGRTVYFNGLSRNVNRSRGRITLRPTGWQSFGFNSAHAGNPVQVGTHTHVEVNISGLPANITTGFFKLELVVGGQTHQLWMRHQNASMVNFQPVAGRPGIFRAQLPAALRGATVTQVQFLGDLPGNITLSSVNFVTP